MPGTQLCSHTLFPVDALIQVALGKENQPHLCIGFFSTQPHQNKIATHRDSKGILRAEFSERAGVRLVGVGPLTPPPPLPLLAHSLWGPFGIDGQHPDDSEEYSGWCMQKNVVGWGTHG